MGISLKDKLLKIDHEPLVSELVNLSEQDSTFRKLITQVVAVCASDDKQLIKLIDKEINAVKKSKKFLDYYEVHSLAKKLDLILTMIKDKLLKKNLEASIKCLQTLLETTVQSMDRVDDSNGVISGCYGDAFELLGEVYAKTNNVNLEKLVDFLFVSIKENDYGVFNNCVKPFYQSLGKEGLTLLENKITQDLQHYKKGDYSKEDLVGALEDIADCRKDVEGYIDILKTYSTLRDQDYYNIALRYGKAWKEELALEWLEKMQDKNTNDYVDLKSKLLCTLGRNAEASNLLLNRFSQTLDLTYYHKLVQKKKDPNEIKSKLLEIILKYQHRLVAINLLCDIREFEKANEIILNEFEAFTDDHYYNIKEIAKKLSKTSFSLASILMYRLVISDLISRASSKYYEWALSYISKILDLGVTVKSWDNKGDNLSFIYALYQAHPRKASFWSGYKHLIKIKQNKKPGIDFSMYLNI